jgi:LuxR family transcriptional regulator, maltose regulon positive regulatory protein
MLNPTACQPRYASSDAPSAAIHYERNDLAEAQACLEAYRPSIAQDFLPLSVVLWHQLASRVVFARGSSEPSPPGPDALSLYAERRNIPWIRTRADWDSVAECLRVDAVDAARALVSRLKLDVEGVAQASMRVTFADDVFDPAVHATRYCIHADQPATALGILRVQAAEASRLGRHARLVKLKVLQSLAHDARGDFDLALASMAAALQLGQELELVRTFLDEGHRCATLLESLDLQETDPRATLGGYRDYLLQSFARARSHDIRTSQATPTQAETLTGREVDILRLIAEGHSTLATGRQLRLSTNTVKWYLSQIYSKLGVNSRLQAIHLVRQNGLL